MGESRRRLAVPFVVLFSTVEAVLGVLLQVGDGDGGRIASYVAVVLAFFACFFFIGRSYSYLFTQLALLFTLFADWFLVIEGGKERLLAMLFFSLAQLSYFARLYAEETPRLRRWHIGIRVGACLLLLSLTVLVLGEGCDALALALVTVFYYANLLTSLAFAFLAVRRSYLFAVGLLLFALCDAVIGFSFLCEYLSLSRASLLYRISHLDFNLAWVFYLPSQALLAISLLPQGRRDRA